MIVSSISNGNFVLILNPVELKLFHHLASKASDVAVSGATAALRKARIKEFTNSDVKAMFLAMAASTKYSSMLVRAPEDDRQKRRGDDEDDEPIGDSEAVN